MPKPRIYMVAREKKTSEVLSGQLRKVFAQHLEIKSAYLEGGMPEIIKAELVLVTLQPYTRVVAPKVAAGTDIMVIRRTLSTESWAKLQAIPSQTKAMLVNDTREAAEETIALLHELGARHLELTPVYPGLQEIPRLDFAITPGEQEYVPFWVQKVVDLGPRVLDISTLADIASKFNLMDYFGTSVLSDVLANIIPYSIGLKSAFSELGRFRQQMGTILDAVNEGVLAYDELDIIVLFNRMLEQLTGKDRWHIVGQKFSTVLTDLGLGQDLLLTPTFYDRFFTHHGKSFLVSKIPLNRESDSGYLITMKETSQIEQQEIKVRQELRQKGLWAKYSFQHIVGRSKAIRMCIQQAKKMTRGDSAILIQGESGVGKELFAQAIHNESKRKNGPFVAINCAALPETLLESELFGYEEGAFTGARRGGKPGLFEQAHQGTIFLDEIADIPLSLQSRLLRVLQEKEVMRIGATHIIPVDVRVIAATNQSLRQLVDKKFFRADLFYRLNVLPLQIPPLRQRMEDLPLLVDNFLVELGDRRRISQEMLAIMRQYSWPGNVRELRNCVEYIIRITDQGFKAMDLPQYLFVEKSANVELVAPASQDISYLILRQLELAARSGSSLGRYQLVQMAVAAGVSATEGQIRTKLNGLKREGLIAKVSARQGHTITDKGRMALQDWEAFFKPLTLFH